MGADMLLFVLWTDGKEVTGESAKAAVRKAIHAETDAKVLERAAHYVSAGLDELANAVVNVDPAANHSWREKIAVGYDDKIDHIIATLSHRDVTTVHAGPLVGYATGGPSWGDSPTETFDEWDTFFSGEDSEGLISVYGGIIHGEMFLGWNGDYADPGDRYIADLVLKTKEADIVAV
jgi:hypothetical protein